MREREVDCPSGQCYSFRTTWVLPATVCYGSWSYTKLQRHLFAKLWKFIFATILLVLNNIKFERNVNIKILHANFLVSSFPTLVFLPCTRVSSAIQNASLTRCPQWLSRTLAAYPNFQPYFCDPPSPFYKCFVVICDYYYYTTLQS